MKLKQIPETAWNSFILVSASSAYFQYSNKYANEAEASLKLFQCFVWIKMCDGLQLIWLTSVCKREISVYNFLTKMVIPMGIRIEP